MNELSINELSSFSLVAMEWSKDIMKVQSAEGLVS